MILCTQCGQQLPDENKFCTNCGAPSGDPIPSPVAPTASPSPSEPQAPYPSRLPKLGKHKKMIAILCSVAFVLLVGVGIFFIFADSDSPAIKESPVEDFEFEITDGEIIITKYIGTDRKIRIPSEIEDRPVTTIGEDAFSGYDLTYIYIPKSVTTIEKYAFRSCECLEEVVFPNSLKSIGKGAFEYCEALKVIELPKNLLELNEDAFFSCSSLTEVHIPSSLVQIGASAFGCCEALETVKFSEGLETICRGAFSGCIKLAKVALPKSLKLLEQNAFGDCDSLQYLEIPDNTEMELSLTSHYISQYKCTYTAFFSPVGGESWYENAPSWMEEEYTTITPLAIILVVSEGSYAHRQASAYKDYGLQFEVR